VVSAATTRHTPRRRTWILICNLGKDGLRGDRFGTLEARFLRLFFIPRHIPHTSRLRRQWPLGLPPVFHHTQPHSFSFGWSSALVNKRGDRCGQLGVAWQKDRLASSFLLLLRDTRGDFVAFHQHRLRCPFRPSFRGVFPVSLFLRARISGEAVGGGGGHRIYALYPWSVLARGDASFDAWDPGMGGRSGADLGLGRLGVRLLGLVCLLGRQSGLARLHGFGTGREGAGSAGIGLQIGVKLHWAGV